MGAGATRHRVVVSALLVGACGGSHEGPSGPAVFADGPGHELPACAPGIGWRAGTRACRVDRAEDLGCVRVIAESSAIRALVWDRCAGPAIDVPIERNARRAKHGATIALVALPASLATPAWRVAIAKALVGDDHVRCETATSTCAAPSAATAWFLDATRAPVADDLDGMFQTTVRWQAGPPARPELEAVVLDPTISRATALTAWEGFDASPYALAILDGHDPLGLLATCTEYELVGNGAAIAAVDRDPARARRWTWVAVADARGGLGRPRCGDGVVFVPRVIDADDPMRATELVARPDTGVFVELDGATRRTLAPAELRGLLVPPRPWPPCAERVPVLTGAPCVAHVDTIAIRPRATERGALLAWLVGDAVVDRRAPFSVIPASLALARRLARDVGCVDAMPGCGPADPIVRWIFGRDRATRFDAAGVVTPHWQRGTAPSLPAPGVALVPYDPLVPKHDEPVGLVYDLAIAGPLARRATCGTLEVWTSPRAGAVVDRAKERWAWLYVDPVADVGSTITGGRCFGDIAVFDYEGLGVAADARTGSWMTLAAARLAELAAAGDPAAAFHDELRADE